MIKNKYMYRVKSLHTDSEHEHVDREFKQYLDKEGSTHERTAPYTK